MNSAPPEAVAIVTAALMVGTVPLLDPLTWVIGVLLLLLSLAGSLVLSWLHQRLTARRPDPGTGLRDE